MLDKKTVGMTILTAATLLVLSGLWCIYLSPVEIFGPSDPNNAWYRRFFEPDFLPNATIDYTFIVEEGQYVRIQIWNDHRVRDAFIYDSENKTVFQERSESDNPFDFIPNGTGQYTLEICNQPYLETYLQIELIGYYPIFRPLASIGQLLILTSLPLYGFSLWLITKKKKTYLDKKTTGMVILTGAMLLLLGGLWCFYLSPVTHFLRTDLSNLNISWNRNFAPKEFQPDTTINYTFMAQEGQYVHIRILNLRLTSHEYFDDLIYDPQNNIIFQEERATGSIYFIPKRTGQYTLKIHNQPDVTTDLTVEITEYHATFRPLTSIGQLLLLISLPLYGFSLWLITRKEKKEIQV